MTLESVKYFAAGSFSNAPTDDIGSKWKYDIVVNGQVTHIPENELDYGATKPYKRIVFDGIEGTCHGDFEFKVTVSATEEDPLTKV